jgi:glycosyltransferase involved in cell wall biosynthesis
VYDSILSDTYIERRERLRTRPVWEPEEGQTFLLLDIPVNRAHTEDLHRLSSLDEIEFVVFLHDLFPLSHKHLFTPAHHPGVRARHLRYLDVVGGADVVVCNSRFTEGQYRKFVELLEEGPDQAIRTVYLPWPELGASPAVAASRNGALKVLTVGGLNQRKNIVTLVRAMRLLIGRGVDARLVIAAGNSAVSDPSLRAEMLDLTAAERSRIEVIATTVTNEHLISLYDDATVVAVPSLAEGFGLPVVEALARRRPVVASDTTAITELARVVPITLVPPTDPEAWSAALVEASAQDVPDIVTPAEFPTDWVDFRRRLLPGP